MGKLEDDLWIPGVFHTLGILVSLWTLSSCGAVGAPLPPEKIGIEAKIRQQQAQEGSAESPEKQIVPIGEDEVILPPLQPLGTN